MADNTWQIIMWGVGVFLALKGVDWFLLPKVLKRKTQAETKEQEGKATGQDITNEANAWALYEKAIARVQSLDERLATIEGKWDAARGVIDDLTDQVEDRNRLLDKFVACFARLENRIRQAGPDWSWLLKDLDIPIWPITHTSSSTSSIKRDDKGDHEE
jgi:uncharacterized coiled-coil protein SlyX